MKYIGLVLVKKWNDVSLKAIYCTHLPFTLLAYLILWKCYNQSLSRSLSILDMYLYDFLNDRPRNQSYLLIFTDHFLSYHLIFCFHVQFLELANFSTPLIV